jgi:hypothetical protein
MNETYTEQEIMESMSETDGYDWALKRILQLQKERDAAQRHVSRTRKQLAGTLSLLALHGIDLFELDDELQR